MYYKYSFLNLTVLSEHCALLCIAALILTSEFDLILQWLLFNILTQDIIASQHILLLNFPFCLSDENICMNFS